MNTRVWIEKVIIPTYKTGLPDKNPMFLENRVYQGSSGVVYPHTVIDKVYDEKEDREWTACFLENEYLKVMILPELGGRIQMALDKTNNYHFIYYNQVIKPALVGLAGPWISGGIEFNWPQHHRPSTYDPIDYSIVENPDGSATVWVNEYEKMFRTKGALGFTLFPGTAYIKLEAKLYNRTPFPQSFLWWANPAVAVNENYQSIFPPDVTAVYDHGKRDVSSFPIAKGTYYKVDYSPGTDISRYSNIPVPTSYMAVNSEFDFVGGYDHGRQAGIMHIADHHVSPGKKQWTWGCGDFGKAWDRQLTDDDGPYIELMCGVFTDNQPDFSWILPDESRQFIQYFLPYKDLGNVKNASEDILLNLDILDNEISISVYVTRPRTVTIELLCGSSILLKESLDLDPTSSYRSNIANQHAERSQHEYILNIKDEQGKTLLSYSPLKPSSTPLPQPAKGIGSPKEISSVEEIYLAAQHLELYRHASFNPMDYYEEGLKRDPSDIRCNNGMGLLLLRKGLFSRSEQYFRVAIERITKHNPNPYDTECLYNLGLSLVYQHKYDEAFDLFYKCTWISAFQDKAYLQMAFIASRRQSWKQGAEFLKKALMRNYESQRIRHLSITMLRKHGHTEEALVLARESLTFDIFSYGVLFEEYLILRDEHAAEAAEKLEQLKELMRDDSDTYLEIAIDYCQGGNYQEALSLLEVNSDSSQPMLHYYKAYILRQLERAEEAFQCLQFAASLSPDGIFPNRIEDIEVLEFAIRNNPHDQKAPYLLGNLFYDKRRYDVAIEAWELSASIKEDIATVHRNLGIAYFNKHKNPEKALRAYEKAFSIDANDARVLFELDNLYKRLKKQPAERLNFLKKHVDLVNTRDDLYLEYVNLHNLTGDLSEANRLLLNRSFHPWEGGEGRVSGVYVEIQMKLAEKALHEGDYAQASDFIKKAGKYPLNLGEGKLYGALENDIDYLQGCVLEAAGDQASAEVFWAKAASVDIDLQPALYYNDQPSEKLYYKALSLRKMQNNTDAEKYFKALVHYGEEHLNDTPQPDFFAVSLPDLMIFDDDPIARNKVYCHYLMALGHTGLGNADLAHKHFNKIHQLDPSHPGLARSHK